MNAVLEQAIRYQYPETIPVNVSFLPAAWIKYGNELQRLADEYPQFLSGFRYDPKTFSYAETYHEGQHIDEWGCVWSNIADGMEAIVTGHPVTCEEDIERLQIPSNRDGRLPHGFMYLRLLDLCGFELAMTLFAEEGPELRQLIDKVLQYNMLQLDALIPSLDKIAYFGDDLGMQRGLAIGPERWRKYIKPCFKALYSKVKLARPDTMIYMHTDGCIWEIIPDLVECGVDIVNPQYRANGLDHLVSVCKGRIPICLDLDRQLFPFATPSEIKSHVRECVEAFYMPAGGFALNAELNHEVPLENIAAMLEALEEYRHYKG